MLTISDKPQRTPLPPSPPVKRRRFLLQWHVTDRCNLRCTHCYQEDGPRAEMGWDAFEDVLAGFRAFLNQEERHVGARPKAHVTVTGGEPFARPDFPRMLEALAASRDRWSFAVLTNGTLIDDALARRLARLRPGFVQVSIDGAEETHDEVRGPGAYAAAVSGLRALVRAGVPAMISFTAHSGNYRELPAVARLGRRLGVRRVWTDRMIPLGRGEADRVLTREQTREWVALLGAEVVRNGRRTEVAALRALQFAAGGGLPYRCEAGRSLLTILSNGDLVPCRRMPRVVGNVLETPLATLYEESSLFRSLRDWRGPAKGCEGCFHARSCGGGLRCLAAATYGDPFVRDPGCWLAPAASQFPIPERVAV